MAQSYQLYGGAISVDLPSGLIDVSNLREVPDTQEVFIQEKNPDPKLDISIIFDLLEKVEADSMENALKIHAEDIGCNSNHMFYYTNEIINESLKVESQSAVFLQASPKKDKYSSAIMIALIRLSKVETDVLITVNVPYSEEEPADEKWIENQITIEGTRFRAGYDILKNAVSSYKVKNWDLFG